MFLNQKPFQNSYTQNFLCKEGSDCICASACALIWYGAPERWGRIGLNRLRAAKRSSFGALPSDVAAKWYSDHSSEFRAYLTEMEVPQIIVDAIFSVSSGEILWQDHDDLDRAPSFAEWQDAACGYWTKEEDDAFHKLRIQSLGNPKNLRSSDRLLWEKLEERWLARNTCLAKQEFNALDALPAPTVVTNK